MSYDLCLKVVLGRQRDIRAQEGVARGGAGQVAERGDVHRAEQQPAGGGPGIDDDLAESLQDRLHSPLQMGRINGFGI